MALIPPFFSDCVVAIGVAKTGDGITWVASGFLFGKRIRAVAEGAPEQYRAYLVTNRHVVQGKRSIFVRVNPAALGPARGYQVDLIREDTGAPAWVGHPLDQVDVAVVPINYDLLRRENMQVQCFLSDLHALDSEGMKAAGQTEGDFIYVLGFPMGLVGEERNAVVVRGGVVARVRETLADPMRRFLVDAPIFPGNSGGPVVSKPEVVAIQGTKCQSDAHLIGIVAAYVPYTDMAVSAQTGKLRITFEENSGLTEAHSIDCVMETAQLYEDSDAGRLDARMEASPEASDD